MEPTASMMMDLRVSVMPALQLPGSLWAQRRTAFPGNGGKGHHGSVWPEQVKVRFGEKGSKDIGDGHGVR